MYVLWNHREEKVMMNSVGFWAKETSLSKEGEKGQCKKQGIIAQKAGEHEFAVFRQNGTEHAKKKKRIKAES